MKTLRAFFLALLFAGIDGAAGAQEKPRILVLTDISNEPDDEESLVRFLVYANEFDVEGLVATTSTWLKKSPREDLIRRDLAAYALVRTNLLKHATGFPTAESLLAVTRTGWSSGALPRNFPSTRTSVPAGPAWTTMVPIRAR